MAKTASNNGRKNTSQSRKTNTQGKKTTAQGRKKQTKKNVQTQADQLKNDCIILFSIACAIIMVLSNFNIAGTLGRGIKWLMFGLFGVMEYIFPVILAVSIIFLMVNRELLRVARIKTAAGYGLFVVLCAMIQCLYNKPDIADNGLGSIFTYCADYKAGGGFFGGLLCKVLSPIGSIGTFVILMILAIICLVIITERSFISGLKKVGNGSQRIMQEAREDYSAYKEHSAGRQNDMSDDEYRRLREEERAKARLKKIEKKEKQLAEKKAREEYLANARMNNVVRGVTSDTLITGTDEELAQDIDIHEIHVDTERNDQYTQDIYEPDEDAFELAYDCDSNAGAAGNVADEPVYADYESHMQQIQPDDYMVDDEVAGNMPEDNTASYDNDYVSDNDNIYENDVTNEEYRENSVNQNNGQQGSEQLSDEQKTEVQVKPVNKPKKAYKFPPVSLLKRNPGAASGGKSEYRVTAQRLQETLLTFGVKVTITDISCGPTVTRYELQPEMGVKVSKIVGLSDDIKLNLAAADIRIEAPIPGKAAVGIEVPNKENSAVMLRDLLESPEFQNSPSKISFAVGKDIGGKTVVADIAKMPHVLIAGATGSGKSVCINTLIMSVLYKADPDEVKLIMIDPKVVELSVYNGIPHLLIPVVTDPKKAAGALNWAVGEMSRRYQAFAKYNVRDMKGYNEKIKNLGVQTEEGEKLDPMPQIIIIVDELADLMMVAPGDVEEAICRLAQLARAAGIHLVLATQRPSVNVITGLIKANMPSRIAFSVSSGVDSRTIIDMNGAEKLLGKGDMLFYPSGYQKPARVQGSFVTDKEVQQVVEYLREHNGDVTYNQEIETHMNTVPTGNPLSGAGGNDDNENDAYFADAGRLIIEKEKASIGMLQRAFKIGFNRAARIMDQLCEAGAVGPEEGTKPRKVLMSSEEFEQYLNEKNG